MFPRPDEICPHPALVSSCPTCQRRSVACPQCGRQSVDDNDGHLPAWCRGCGADLRAPHGDGKVPYEDLLRPVFGEGQVSPRRYSLVLMGLAVVCGLAASYFTSTLVQRAPEPPRRIERETYSMQPPDSCWHFDEQRWRVEQADLVLEPGHRSERGAFFIVHVVRPGNDELTLDEMVRQIEQQWPSQLEGCQFLARAEPATVAGQPALRVVAVGKPKQETSPDHVAGDRLRREAIVLVHGGIGYRLTCEANERRFESMRNEFAEIVGSIQFLEK